MASVIFAVDYKDENKIEALYEEALKAREDATRAGVGNSDGSGFRVGTLLKGWNGRREEISFAIQSWDEFRPKFEAFATNFHAKYKFDGLRTIGLTMVLVK